MEITEHIKINLEYITRKYLKNSGVYREYTDKDLVNATIILQEVFMAKMYNFHKDKLTDYQMQQLAEEAGKSIHQTVKLFTGVDLHEAVKL